MSHYLLLVFLLFSTAASAQTDEERSPLVTVLPEPADKVENGWTYPAAVSLGSSLSWYDNVVGAPEGRSSQYSLDIDTALRYVRNQLEWRNRFQLQETVTRTPLVDDYIKTVDELNVETILMRFSDQIPWLGYYGRIAYKTQAFQGFDVRTEENIYVIQEANGDIRQESGEKLLLTDAFKPAIIKEGLGGVARPVQSTPVNVEGRLGLGARQYLADGQLLVDDDDQTEGVIELVELRDSSQYGAESALSLTGILYEKKISYELYSEAFVPFSYTPKDEDDERSLADVTSSELGAKLNFFLTEWAALTYNFRTRKEPLLFPRAQTSHNVLFNITFKTE